MRLELEMSCGLRRTQERLGVEREAGGGIEDREFGGGWPELRFRKNPFSLILRSDSFDDLRDLTFSLEMVSVLL